MKPDSRYLEQRIKQLEEKVFQLRLSRRVLMYLLEEANREREMLIHFLKQENERLRLANYRYAKTLLSKNRQIVDLQCQLEEHKRMDLES